MPKFYATKRVATWVVNTYEIEADTQKEAAGLLFEGNGDYLGHELSDCLDRDTAWSVPQQMDAPPALRHPLHPQNCEYCGSSDDVTFDPDPFDADVNDDLTPHWLCGECRDNRWRDI